GCAGPARAVQPVWGAPPETFFFFQAEDGIRDFHVTGVQTCALPIWSRPVRPSARSRTDRTVHASHRPRPDPCAAGWRATAPAPGIGRASCRERVWISGVAA